MLLLGVVVVRGNDDLLVAGEDLVDEVDEVVEELVVRLSGVDGRRARGSRDSNPPYPQRAFPRR